MIFTGFFRKRLPFWRILDALNIQRRQHPQQLKKRRKNPYRPAFVGPFVAFYKRLEKHFFFFVVF